MSARRGGGRGKQARGDHRIGGGRHRRERIGKGKQGKERLIRHKKNNPLCTMYKFLEF